MQYIKEYLRKNYKVISFDMDGTLIKGTSSNLFYAKLLDVEQEVMVLEDKLVTGEIVSDDFMIQVSEIMGDLTVKYVISNFELLPIVEGIEETVHFFKELDIVPIIVTTSNILFAECFKKKYGFELVYGTTHEVLGGGRIGRGKIVCSKEHKIQHVNELVQKLGGTMENVIAIGDSHSDVPLFSRVGCSIAFNYDESLKGKADIYVESDTIFDIIPAMQNKLINPSELLVD